MPKFFYKAKSSAKELKEGVVEADTEAAAIYKIGQMGYFPVEISKETSGAAAPFFYLKKKTAWKDIAEFSRQLADLLASGLTILRALDVLVKQTDNPRFRFIIDDVRVFIRDGGTFSEGLSRHPEAFSGVYVSMIKAGESGAMLEQVLSRLADYAEAEDQLRDRVVSALVYPALTAIVGTGTIIVLLTFVIPKIVTIFQDLNQSLPLPTLMLISLSAILTRYGWVILPVLAIAFFILNRQSKTKDGKFIIDNIKLKMPVIGRLIQKAEIARFAKTLGTLLANGVPMMQALKIAGSVIENAPMARDIEQITKDVASGAAFSNAIIKANRFPLSAVNMIAVGDESGHLEKALLKVSESCERDVDRLAKAFAVLLEPLIILFMGGVVGFIVISMLLPIFQLNFMVK